MYDMVVETLPPGQWRRPISSDNNERFDTDKTLTYASQNQHCDEEKTKSTNSPLSCSSAMILAPELSEAKQAPVLTVAQSSDRETIETELHEEEKNQDDHDIESSRAATPKVATHVAESSRAEVDHAVLICELSLRGDNEGSSIHRNPQNIGQPFVKTSSPTQIRNYSMLWSNSQVNEANVLQANDLSSPKSGPAEKCVLPNESCSQTGVDAKVTASKTETKPRRSSRKPTPNESLRINSGPRQGDITLSFSDEIYKEIMWKHYNILGKKLSREKDMEKTVVHQILQSLKKRLGKRGRFFKRITQSNICIVVDDEEALQSKK
jgi:hypothetical protein